MNTEGLKDNWDNWDNIIVKSKKRNRRWRQKRMTIRDNPSDLWSIKTTGTRKRQDVSQHPASKIYQKVQRYVL